MSWLYSRVLVEEYLGDNCLDGEQSVPLSGNPTPQAYCSPDRMTAFSRISRFGMTFKPLTESRGEELLTLYLEDFRAKTSAVPEKELESKDKKVECGRNSQELLARYDPSTSLWRTAQCSLLEDLEQCLETWPRWGSMRNGACYQQPMLVQTTNERESGYWLTPATVNIPIRSEESMQKRFEYRKNIGRNGVGAGCLAEQVEWSGTGSPVGYVTKQNWPTPTAHMAEEAAYPAEFLRKTPTLAATVAMRKFPTPQASDNRDRGNMSNPSIQRRVAMGKQIMLSQSVDQNSGQLNPPWVEKLMGWPDEWTCLNPISHVKICFWLMGFCDGEENRTTEVLRVLRRGYAAQEVREAIGRFVGISEAAILLAKLCEHAHRFDEARLFMACAKALEEAMRGVRLCESITSAPHRPKQDLQQTREYPDTMQALSRLLAHYGKTAWKDGSWEDAVPRVANGVAARVDRLKAIGNGQVPLCAATAFKLLKERIGLIC